MRDCVLPNQVNDGRVSAAGIVKIRQSICEAWAQMEKGTGRLIRHARVAIRRGGNNSLE
jgi:hypothetical protein